MIIAIYISIGVALVGTGMVIGFFGLNGYLRRSIALQDKIICDFAAKEREMIEAIRKAEYRHNLNIYG